MLFKNRLTQNTFRIMTNLYKSLSAILRTQLLPVVLLTLCSFLPAQTTVLSEDFNNCALAPDWSTTILKGLVDWQFGYNENNNAWASNSMNGSCFAFFDDEEIGNNALPSVVRLNSPVFNGADYAQYILNFDVVFRKQKNLEHFSVYVYDGTTYTLVEEYYDAIAGEQFNNYQNISLDLSAFRTENMQVIFHYDDGGGEGWWVGLDNISVIGIGILNDRCTNAFDLSLGQSCLEANNSTAIFTGAIPSCHDQPNGSLWYRFISPVNGILHIETRAEFNDLITVFEGNCNNMTPIACHNRDEHGFIGESQYLNIGSADTYMIRVSGVDSDFGLTEGDLCISLTQVSAFPDTPVNDDCNNAIPLTVDAVDCTEGNNNNANFNGPEPSLNLKTRSDVWYTFEATANTLEINTAADFADAIAVYSGSCGNFTEVAVNEFGQHLLLENLILGNTYYVQIGGFFATLEGDLCVRVATPAIGVAPNDLCSAATLVNVNGTCVSGENIFAGFDGPNPSCEIFPVANVWYRFIAPATGSVQINTGSTFPHVVSVYSGTCINLEEILCVENPLYCNGYFNVMDLMPGQTYYVQIAASENAFGYHFGDLCLSILDIPSDLAFEPMLVLMEVNCIDEGIATLAVVATGGQGGYTIEGHTTGDTLITGQQYFTVVSDAEGCEVAITGTVECGNQPCVLGASLSVTGASCYNGNDGEAEIVIAPGNNDPYSFNWSNGSTAALQQNLQPGLYFVTVENAGGCSEMFSALITNPQSIIANASATPESALNASDGTATANPTGGTPPYSYLWTYNNATTQTITGLTEGFYSVVIFDANNCSQIATVNVASYNCQLGVSITAENINCAGLNDGTLTALATNGNGESSYVWSNGATSANVQNLAPGIYSVTVTDDNACQTIGSATLSAPTPVVGALLSTSDVSCFNGNDGSATVQASGGVAPFTYSWPGGSTGDIQTALAAGSYVVTFTDANGCTGTIPVTISEPTELLASIPIMDQVSCFSNDDGSATAFAQGGTPGYSYLWNDPMNQSSATASDLTAGTYTVTITDNNMCTNTAQTTISEPTELIASIPITDQVSCFSNDDGSATAFAQGGTPGYSYLWNDPMSQTSATASNLTAGTYTVTITDNNMCTNTAQTTITEPTMLLVTVDNVTAEVGDLANGSISITPTGGTPPYSFTWVLAGVVISNEEDISGLESAGNYRVLVQDANGCTFLTADIVVQNLVGVSDPELEGAVLISPNPTSGAFVVDVTLDDAREVQVDIFDVLGRKVVSKDLGIQSGGRFEFDLKDAGAGLYFVKVLLGDKVFVGEMVVQ
jgi:SprB repeat/Secretion system C-terminal sorting domain